MTQRRHNIHRLDMYNKITATRTHKNMTMNLNIQNNTNNKKKNAILTFEHVCTIHQSNFFY